MNLPSRTHLRALFVLVLLTVQIDSAWAWIYPEHRDIGVLAVEKLDPERKALLDAFWAEARKGHEERLCAMAADTQQGLAPSCIDWAALNAIAGDHSCSGRDLAATAENSDWILTVADVAAQLKADLARIGPSAAAPRDAGKNPILDLQRSVEQESVRAARVNALRTADTRLQRADPAYATRADSNGAHFLLPRASTNQSAREYAEMTLTPGAEINAIGVYFWYHLSALQAATRLAHDQLAPAERQSLARAMLIDEAFALHFLEDTFAAGHIAGAWGDASQRKGTHDYYNEAGIEVFFWGGSSNSAVLLGDAHMRPQDAERAARAVRASLEEVIDVAAGRPETPAMTYTPKAPSLPDDFDVCKNDVLVRRQEGLRATPEAIELVAEVLRSTPIPSLGPGLGSMPRFRAEVGPFVGIAGSTALQNVDGGFVAGQDQRGWIGDVDLSVRAGLGLDGVLGEAGDGLVFASIGLRGDSASTNKVSASALAEQAGSLGAAIPSRMGISTRIRMPFYLIPGDLLLAAPLFLVDRTAYANMAVTASNGGLIPWQQGLATSIGRFQFVLGRELGVTFYGRLSTTSLVAPATGAGTPPTVVNFKSISYELPILEYRPYRAFDSRQSSAALVQLFVGADVPKGDSVAAPIGAAMPPFRRVYSIGVRMIFDWRSYFGMP